MTSLTTNERAELEALREALDQILNGTRIDKLNRNDDGLDDFIDGRAVMTHDVKRWADIARPLLSGDITQKGSRT